MPQISELPTSSSLEGTELVPLVQDGVTKKVLVSTLRQPQTPLVIKNGEDTIMSSNATELIFSGNVDISGVGSTVTVGIQSSPVSSVNGMTGDVSLNSTSVGAAPIGHVGGGGSSHATATTSLDGFMSAADKSKLNEIAALATANNSNEFLLNRANHTGTQSISTVTGLTEALASKLERSPVQFLTDDDVDWGITGGFNGNAATFAVDAVNDFSVSIPESSSFIPGDSFSFVQLNTGKVIIVPAVGVTVLKRNSAIETSTASTGSYITIKNISENLWVLYGDLTEASFLSQLVANINYPAVVIDQSQISS